MNLKNILKDLNFGRKQEIGAMSVIPLIGEDSTDKLANFDQVNFCGTDGYGTMVFKNNADKPFIVPTGYSIVTTQEAQDHALTFATLLKPEEHKNVGNACCIQQTQCGYIDGTKVKDFKILPLYIRKKHFEKYIPFKKLKGSEKYRSDYSIRDFSRLWPLISDFQKELVKSNEGNLILFFNKFMDQLSQFNAEFEIVPEQRGAIIMLNGKIVGIEIAPTHDYWKTVWNSLIRDCYGAEVIRLTTLNLIKEFKDSQELSLSLEDCNTIDEIEAKLSAYNEENQQKDMNTLYEILENDTVDIQDDNSLIKDNSFDDLNYNLFKVADKPIYGEAYTIDDKVIYASILA